MSDAPVVFIGENSPEQIAFKLLTIIAANEGKTFEKVAGGTATASADRKWLLDTYAECLQTVSNPGGRQRH
jgi:hypothetical protein